jgi:hypothetical protein
MRIAPAVSLCVFIAGTGPALQACALMTAPITTVLIEGAQLAIRGVELQKEIRKADIQEAIDIPFQGAWVTSVGALADLGIEISRIEKNREGDGGLIEGSAKKIKVKVVAVSINEKITEIGIWADHDKALAELIGEKIKEEAHKQDNQAVTTNPDKENPL